MNLTSTHDRGNFDAILGRRLFLTTADILVFTFIAGILATLRARYGYGLINHIEHLPPILHITDPSLFAGDWHVQESMHFGPRYFYYHLLAFLSSYAPLDAVMLVLTVLGHFATLLISFLFARDLFRNDLAALFGCVLIAAVHSIDLGLATFIIFENLVQASLAEPFAMLSIWAGIRLRPTLAFILAGISAILHPVVGLETGVIALGVVGFAALVRWYMEKDEDSGQKPAIQFATAVTGVLALAVLAYIVFLSRMEGSLTDEAFFDILVHFRNPHHYVPSEMGAREYGRFLLFLSTLTIAWIWWRNDAPIRDYVDRVGFVVGIVLILLVAAWFFVEVIPTRTVASMQLYRMVYLVKWIGLLLIGRSIAYWLQQGTSGRWTALIAISGTGVAQPVTSFAAHALWMVRHALGKANREKLSTPVYIVLSLLVLAFVIVDNNLREYFFLVLMLGLASWFVIRERGMSRWLSPFLVAIVLFPLLVAFRDYHPVLEKSGVFTLEDANDSIDPVARYARENTPQSAVFVVSPMSGRFRLVSGRAVVVDFKSFVFQDASIAEWMERITDVYGRTELTGFPAAFDLESQYHHIPDDRLAFVAEKYGADYAVLYSDTASRYPVVYEDGNFKLVHLRQPENRKSL